MPEPESTAATTTRAGLAGAGGGTGLIAVAESLGGGGTTREILLYLAPTASVIVGALTYYLELTAKRYLQRRLVASVRKRLTEYLDNPMTSEEHKATLVKQLESLEQTVVIQDVERIRLIGESDKPAPAGD